LKDLEVNCKEGQVCQVGIVVRDLEESVRKMYHDFNIGPWYFWDFEQPALTDMYYKGKPMKGYGFKIALASLGPVQCELIQPLYGEGTHTEFLAKKGEGLHHMKLYFKDPYKVLETFKDKGIMPLQSGRYGDDIHIYLDTEKTHGFLLELGNNCEIGKYLKKYPE